MTRSKAGVFTDAMKNYFNAETGGFTAVTETEINKRTYNIKSCIRTILIDKLGRPNIPKRGDLTPTIIFHLAEDLAAKHGPTVELVCKFSKPTGDEMSLYFSRGDFIHKTDQHPGDIWCIYFKPRDPNPWFGYIKKDQWAYIENPAIGDTSVEPDEVLAAPNGKIAKLTYEISVDLLHIHEEPAPIPSGRRASMQKKSRSANAVSTSDMKSILKNQKAKGSRGEEIIFKYEKARLIASGQSDLASKVRWVAKRTDGLGYDIKSFEQNPETLAWEDIFIEVKTTSLLSPSTPFFVSKNEKQVSAEKGHSYYIYRIYAMEKTSSDISFYRLNGSLEDNFTLIPSSFLATPK